MTTIIKVRWIIIKDNKIFLVRDSETGNFMLPWWKQENWETIKQTLYRELKEEIWVDVIIDKFIWFNEYISRKWEITIQFLFKIKNINDFEKIDKEKCSHWFEWSEAGFYDIKYLKENNFDIPSDLAEIFNNAILEKNNYSFLS